ncbi:MAG: sulfotransferase [Mariniblastus sp.]|nr:sulfotransferase [Mariniblastus sp.]
MQKMSKIELLFEEAVQKHQAGDLTAAAIGYAAVLKENSRHSDAWHFAGLIAHQMGNADDALQQIKYAIEIDPTNPEYFSNLASIFNSMGEQESALVSADKAIEISPEFAPAFFQRGIALGKQNKNSDALLSFYASSKAGFSEVKVLAETARIKQFQGDFLGAIEDIQKALAIDDDNPQAYFQLSQFVNLGEYQFTETQLDSLRNLLELPNPNLTSSNLLNVAMAVHLEKEQEFAGAFEHYTRAAGATHALGEGKGQLFKEGQRQSVIDDLIEFFTPETIERFAKNGNPSAAPVFIVGMPRSGTTLVQQMLSRHSAVEAVGELDSLDDLIKSRFGDASQVRLREMFKTLDDFWIRAGAQGYIDQLTRYTSFDDLGEGGGADFAMRFIDKMPANYFHIGFITMLFPNARIINCIRDPRDVCLSCYFQSFAAENLQFITSRFGYLTTIYRNYARLMNHWRSVAPDSVFDVCYESLTEAPEAIIKPVVKHLGLDWESSVLEFHNSDTPVSTASAVQVRRPIYTTSTKKWKRYEPQLAEFLEMLGPEIADYESAKQ